jgi:hypothetical protein
MSNLDRRASRLPYWLLAGYVMLFAALAVNPVAREVWWTENLTFMTAPGHARP